MKVIGCTSQLAMGKDTFCDYLAIKLNQYDIKWTRGAFANAVKETFCNAFGVDRDFIEKWKRIPENPPGFLMPIRQCLQFIGDGYRKIRDEIWIEIALRDNGQNLIISDGRYFNEAKRIKEKDGIMFLIYRPGYLNNDPNPSESQIRPLLDWAKNNLNEGPIDHQQILMHHHVSTPSELMYFDYYLVNDGSIEDFYEKIQEKVVPYILQTKMYQKNDCI